MCMETIYVENCNCIKKANIKIEKNAFNIKYGLNGTGKSTISSAIEYKSKSDVNSLNSLIPYWENEVTPIVSGLNFKKIKVFNEKYVNDYLFIKNENDFFSNSFNVFLKNDEIDNLSSEIEKLLDDLQKLFQNEKLDKLDSFLIKFYTIFQFKNNKITKSGGIKEFFNGNGAGFEKHDELAPYKDFYSSNYNFLIKWAKWRTSGIEFILNGKCPFCANKLNDDINKQNDSIKTIFKNAAIESANKVLDYLTEAVDNNYICSNTIDTLKEYIESSKTDELYSQLNSLGLETDYLHKKLTRIKEFRPIKIETDKIKIIDEVLNDLNIEKREISKFYITDLINSLIDEITTKINELKTKTTNLKSLFNQYNSKLNKMIKEKQTDINYFFEIAGFPYEFKIDINDERKANSYLVSCKKSVQIVEPKNHLSWGEKNAFSLIMFMFEAISENSDLIILDDPISSFDKNKKFAVIKRLFDNKKPSFKNMTVLMFTHDIQPIIDCVHNKLFNSMGLTTKVNASLLENIDGEIKEINIESSDLVNALDFSLRRVEDNNCNMVTRIVNLRKYIEMSNSNYQTLDIYDVLSNLIHGREIPTKNDGTTKLEDTIINNGLKNINENLSDENSYTYEELLEKIEKNNLLSLFNSGNSYEKALAARLLLERDESKFRSFKKNHPGSTKFLNETNHIENDYIFQLDPLKFFNIPDPFLKEIENIINI